MGEVLPTRSGFVLLYWQPQSAANGAGMSCAECGLASVRQSRQSRNPRSCSFSILQFPVVSRRSGRPKGETGQVDVVHAKRTVRRGVQLVSISPADPDWLPDESVSLDLQSGEIAPAESMATGQRLTFGQRTGLMGSCRFLRWLAVIAACVKWVLPTCQLLAATPDQARPAPTTPSRLLVDVALDASGRLSGQIVDSSGKPRATHAVSVQSVAGDRPMRAVSDREGRFVLEGVSGGVYRVTSNEASAICRCWKYGTAPPAATQQLLLVASNSVERGQKPIGELLCSTPVLVGLIIAAAIAIPVSVHNANKDEPSS